MYINNLYYIINKKNKLRKLVGKVLTRFKLVKYLLWDV